MAANRPRPNSSLLGGWLAEARTDTSRTAASDDGTADPFKIAEAELWEAAGGRGLSGGGAARAPVAGLIPTTDVHQERAAQVGDKKLRPEHSKHIFSCTGLTRLVHAARGSYYH
eukprot:SAG22_NODE_493_length_9820_cov_53.085588_8_plen_114_part_00